MNQRPLTGWRLAAFAAPCVPIAALGLPISLYLPQFYASSQGLGLGLVGTLFMVARLWDVVCDPMIGFLSDRYPSRWGHRRPWIIGATPLISIATWFVFMPPATTSATYLLGWLLVLYLGWTMLTIPHLSWAAELSEDYHQRSRIQGFREAGEIIGIPLVLVRPAIIERIGGDNMEAHRIAAMGGFLLILLPIAVLISVRSVDEPPRRTAPPLALASTIRTLITNQPLGRVILADTISGAAGASVGALFLYMVSEKWHLGDRASLLMLIYFLAGLGFVPLIVKASYRFGKHQTLIGCCAFYVVCPPLALVIPDGNFAAAAGLMVLLGVNVGGAGLLLRSIMADVADLDEHRAGEKRTGLLYSFMALTRKAGGALAVGGTFWALQAIGFNGQGQNSAVVIDQLAWLFVAVPTLCNLVVMALMWRFPLDGRRQSELRDALNASPVGGLQGK